MSKKSIEYLAGYTVKPFQVLANGQVIFTDNSVGSLTLMEIEG